MRGNAAVFNRFVQYGGRLYVSTITIGELTAWMFRTNLPVKLQSAFGDLQRDVVILDVTQDVAAKYGEVRAHQLHHGTRSPQVDLWIACTALTHDLTVVTHNTADFVNIPNLRLVDWLT